MPVAKTKLNAAEQLHQLQDAFNRQKEEIDWQGVQIFGKFEGFSPVRCMIGTYLLNMQTRRNNDSVLEKKAEASDRAGATITELEAATVDSDEDEDNLDTNNAGVDSDDEEITAVPEKMRKKCTTNSDDEPTADTERKPKKKAKSNRAVTSDDEDAVAEPQPRGKKTNRKTANSDDEDIAADPEPQRKRKKNKPADSDYEDAAEEPEPKSKLDLEDPSIESLHQRNIDAMQGCSSVFLPRLPSRRPHNGKRADSANKTIQDSTEEDVKPKTKAPQASKSEKPVQLTTKPYILSVADFAEPDLAKRKARAEKKPEKKPVAASKVNPIKSEYTTRSKTRPKHILSELYLCASEIIPAKSCIT
ncbi:hypothetical protein B0H14DRAFT_3717872 [Mycena olivaceomarginata]|nr:hypothetical protein B0H14DRAFT_3717872 [Mycena olivaceomarginata]